MKYSMGFRAAIVKKTQNGQRTESKRGRARERRQRDHDHELDRAVQSWYIEPGRLRRPYAGTARSGREAVPPA
jgi:hypothetical protein